MDLKDQHKAAEVELTEADTKLAEAAKELGPVRVLAAEGAVINTFGQVAECMAPVLGSHMEAGVEKGLFEQGCKPSTCASWRRFRRHQP